MIGQSDFSSAGCSKYCSNDLACNAFIRSPNAHYCYEIHFEFKVSHGNPNVESPSPFPLDSYAVIVVTRVTPVRTVEEMNVGEHGIAALHIGPWPYLGPRSSRF